MDSTQEVFDKIVKHLLTQNEKSIDIGCMYRSPKGLKCAVGCLIDDAVYLPRLEGLGVEDARVLDMLARSGVPVASLPVNFLFETQMIHDGAAPDMWPSLLSELALKYDLEYKGAES